jgi:hypothetical protein
LDRRRGRRLSLLLPQHSRGVLARPTGSQLFSGEMPSVRGPAAPNLDEREVSQLDALANGSVDASVPDEAIQPADVDASETRGELDLAAQRKGAARFLATIDRPLWRFDPSRLSVGSEPTTFLELIGAREEALAGKNSGVERDR